jgi:putative colanic acid biosynthesis glycosyltransferase
MFTNHQAMLYNTAIIKENALRYDLSYKIAADYKFTLEFLKLAQTILYINIPLCIFSLDGISNKNKQKGLLETERVRREVLYHNNIQCFLIRLMLLTARLFSEKLSHLYNFLRYN